MQKKRARFTAAATIVAVIVVAVVGFTVWFAYHSTQLADANLKSANEVSSDVPKLPQIKTFADCQKAAGSKTLTTAPEQCVTVSGKKFTDTSVSSSVTVLKNHVTITNSKGWQLISQARWNADKNDCSQGAPIDPVPVCVATLSLIPQGETYTNPDQFVVDISVFKSSETKSTAWLPYILGDLTGGVTTTTSINGLSVSKLAKTYTNSGAGNGVEIDLAYGIAGNGYGILVRSRPFEGNHYSYVNTAKTDYRTYIPKIDALVGSIEIK